MANERTRIYKDGKLVAHIDTIGASEKAGQVRYWQHGLRELT